LALVVVPTALLIIGVTGYIAAVPRQHILRLMFLWSALFIVTMYVFWPVLWFNADQAWGLLSERASLHSEGTREAETTSRSWYYLRELAFRLTVPSTLLLPVGLVGLVVARPAVARWSTVWLLIAGLAYLAAISYGSDKSDRYALFTLLVFDVVAAYGLWFVSTYRAGRFRKYAYALLLLAVGWLSLDAMRLHPYYLAHYNRLYPIETDHKLGWGEGLEQAAAWITEQSPTAKVFSYYPRVFKHWYAADVESLVHFDEGSGDYAVLYRSMFERGPGAFETDLMQSFLNNQSRKPAHTVVINGLPYAWIYTLGEE
jgi:hypothetical protein